MKNIVVRKLGKADHKTYRSIRLELLKLEPTSFGSSFDEESLFSEDIWISRLTKENVYTVGAFIEDKIVGIAVNVLSPRKKMKHISTLNSMYVIPKYRGKGIASSLINDVISNSKSTGVEIMKLSVVTTNTSALKLYKSKGFTVNGEDIKAIKYENEYFNLYLMSKELG